jgi:hypothetical protein
MTAHAQPEYKPTTHTEYRIHDGLTPRRHRSGVAQRAQKSTQLPRRVTHRVLLDARQHRPTYTLGKATAASRPTGKSRWDLACTNDCSGPHESVRRRAVGRHCSATSHMQQQAPDGCSPWALACFASCPIRCYRTAPDATCRRVPIRCRPRQCRADDQLQHRLHEERVAHPPHRSRRQLPE